MRTIIFVTFVALLAIACTDTTQPVTALSQPETSGNPSNAGQQGNAFSISTEAYYQASLDSTSSPGRVIGLTLKPKGEAEMTTYHLNKSPATIDRGEWTTLDNGNLLLKLRRVGKKDSTTLEFKTDGDKLVYTGSEYGTAGLILWVKSVPASK